MAAHKYNHRSAFTLIEVLVTAMAAVILIVGLSAMLFYGQRGYNTMYRRINSEVVRNGYEARRVFDAIVRKSTIERCDILSPDDIYGDIYLYYYYDETAPLAPAPEPLDRYHYMIPAQPDRFARFYVKDTSASGQLELYVMRGLIPPGVPLFALDPTSLQGPEMLLAKHVVSCKFNTTGTGSVQMILTLNDEDDPEDYIYSETQTLKMVVTTTAVRHNKIRE